MIKKNTKNKMKEELNKFKNWLIIKGKSEGTIKIYCCRIKNFLNKVTDFTEENINNYLLELRKTLMPASSNGYRNAICAFLKFKGIEIDLACSLKTDEKIPEFITLDFLKKTLDPAIDWNFKNPLRIKAILYTMFFTGLRKKDIASLKTKNFDLKNKTVKVYMKKGKKERIIPISKTLHRILDQYFSTRLEEQENAFNISGSGIDSIFGKLKELFKDTVNLYPHLFRHSFGTHLINNNIPIEIIQYLMGHSSLISTKIYVHTNINYIKTVFHKNIK